MSTTQVRVGCAGWSIGRDHAEAFSSPGAHLPRYAARLACVEINTSFYQPHRPQTYARWAASVPEGFRFSVKVPQLITHAKLLHDCEQALDEFLAQCTQLGAKLGCLLVQLPPSLVYHPPTAEAFFKALRQRYAGGVVVEPRHASWLGAESLLIEHRVAQAAVDPSRIRTDPAPGGWPGLRYWRLHGSPRIYHDAYGEQWLEDLARQLRSGQGGGVDTWCIFDNTASGAALGNALTLANLTSPGE